MSSVISHCVILLMKPIWDLKNNKQELNEYKESKGEYMGSLYLKILHLEGADQTELIAVKSALKKSARCFRDVTGDDRQFLVGVRKLNDKSHPAHLLLKWGGTRINCSVLDLNL